MNTYILESRFWLSGCKKNSTNIMNFHGQWKWSSSTSLLSIFQSLRWYSKLECRTVMKLAFDSKYLKHFPKHPLLLCARYLKNSSILPETVKWFYYSYGQVLRSQEVKSVYCVTDSTWEWLKWKSALADVIIQDWWENSEERKDWSIAFRRQKAQNIAYEAG